MNVDKWSVGRRIKQVRLSLGMNRVEFGALFDASGSLVSKWEKGVNLPKSNRLANIAFQGQISVDELLHGDTIIINTIDLFSGQSDLRKCLVVDVGQDERFHLTELDDISEDAIDTVLSRAVIYLDMDKLPKQIKVKRAERSEE